MRLASSVFGNQKHSLLLSKFLQIAGFKLCYKILIFLKKNDTIICNENKKLQSSKNTQQDF